MCEHRHRAGRPLGDLHESVVIRSPAPLTIAPVLRRPQQVHLHDHSAVGFVVPGVGILSEFVIGPAGTQITQEERGIGHRLPQLGKCLTWPGEHGLPLEIADR